MKKCNGPRNKAWLNRVKHFADTLEKKGRTANAGARPPPKVDSDTTRSETRSRQTRHLLRLSPASYLRRVRPARVRVEDVRQVDLTRERLHHLALGHRQPLLLALHVLQDRRQPLILQREALAVRLRDEQGLAHRRPLRLLLHPLLLEVEEPPLEVAVQRLGVDRIGLLGLQEVVELREVRVERFGCEAAKA